MAEESINDLLLGVPLQSSEIRSKAANTHRVCSNQKQQAVSGEAYTKEQVNKLNAEEVDKLFSIRK